MRITSPLSAAVLLTLSRCITVHVVASKTFQITALQGQCGTLYKVVSGDGCWGIADNAQITQDQLAALNPDLNCATMGVGDGLCLFLPCATFYTVQSGEWCAKIQDEQNISAADLTSLNPGFDCDTLFGGQRLCLAAPTVPTPTGDPAPPTGPTYAPAPTYSCDQEIPITLGDTCYDLAVENSVQLSMFTTVNSHLNCTTLQPGSMACVRPKCGSMYRVQSGDWCAKIESDHALASGQLVTLNPGLSCDALAPDQALCVAPAPTPEVVPAQPLSLKAQDLFPVLAPGTDLPQTPILSFVNAANPRDSLIGKLVFQQDAQHLASFAKADVNGDGEITLDELQRITQTNNQIHRGMQTFDSSWTADSAASIIMNAADTNKDGSLSQDEYMAAVAKSQSATNDVIDAQVANMQRRALGQPEKRGIAPIVIGGIVAFLTLLFGISAAAWMSQLEARARDRAAGLLDYLDVRFWDRGNEAEPTCSVYMYYSSSCAALGTSWASHCSEGGDKVFPESCNGLFTDGAQACGFLGCSSMCYKINADNCDCDALNYTPEEGTAYTDTPFSTTSESGVSPCRTKCSQTNGCVGFTVSATNKDNTVSCKIFKAMTNKKEDQYTAAFKLVGSPVGSGTNPICPAPPPGYAPYPAAQIQKDREYGEVLSNRYASSGWQTKKRTLPTQTNDSDADVVTMSSPDSSTPIKRDTCSTEWPQKRGFLDLNASEASFAKRSNGTVNGLVRRTTPISVDLRLQFQFIVKNQGLTQTCASHSFTTMMEGSVMKQLGRVTPKQLSVTWIARCRAGILSSDIGASWDTLYSGVKDSYQATESCMPWTSFDATRDNECRENQCAAGTYGKLPYISFPTEYKPSLLATAVGGDPVERMKETLRDFGPIWMVFRITQAFQQYAAYANMNPSPLIVFYDTDPQWTGHDCGYVEHAMTVVGYGHYRHRNDPCNKGLRLYWIVQNSWGTQAGYGGYMYIEFASLASTAWSSSYSVKVEEGAQWVSSKLPSTWG